MRIARSPSLPTDPALSDPTASIAGLFALAAAFGVALLVVLLPRARALRERLEQASALQDAPQTLEYQGRRIDVRFGAAQDGAPLLLSTAIARQPALRLRPLTRLDRFARRCGLARVAASGDADFDRLVLVDCDYRELAAVMLREPATRSAVLALLAAGARRLNLAGSQLVAEFRPATAADDTLDLLRRRAARVGELAQQLPALVGALTPISTLWPMRRLSLLAGCVVLPLLAFSACAFGLRAYPPLDLQALVLDALRNAPLWWLALLVPALLWLRGHPDSARLLPPSLLAATLAAPAAAIATDLLRNGRDARAARDTVVAVTGSVMLSGATAPTLRWSSTALQQRGLFGTTHALSADVDEAQWRNTPIARARLQARIAPGALGHPWLLAVSATTAADDGAIDAVPAPVAEADPPAQGTALQLAVALPPADVSGPALLDQARTLYSDGALGAARETLDRAVLQLERENAAATVRADAHWYRATVYGSLGIAFERQQEADARAALALVPGHTGAALLLDDVLLGRRRYADALDLWNLVLAEQPAYRYGHYKRAQLLATLGQLAEARSEAQATCELGERAACELLDSFQ